MAPAGTCSTSGQDGHSWGGSGPWVKLEAAKNGIVIAITGRIFVNTFTICLQLTLLCCLVSLPSASCRRRRLTALIFYANGTDSKVLFPSGRCGRRIRL